MFSKQLLDAVAYIHNNLIIHCDLKPDNILISEDFQTIFVSDFGSASYMHEIETTPYLVSRYYRAPEVILGLKWDSSIDIWSVGCTLYELYTGKILFNGKSNNLMLYEQMKVLGKFPTKIIRKGEFSNRHFVENDYHFIKIGTDKITQKVKST
jgi:serine/threonine-protein kinase PRP4